MGLFNKKQEASAQLSQKQILANTINGSRHNILLVVAFTIINVILLATNSNTYFLFSAYVPYMLMDYGMYFGGMYPAEYYGEYFVAGMAQSKGFFLCMIALIIVVLALYVLCWAFSKKNPKGWLIFALVLFGIDTVMLLVMLELSFDLILDYVFHGWVIVSLVKGISAIKKWNSLPEEEEVAEGEAIREAEVLSVEE